MTDQLERRLREEFAADAERAPVASDLATSARALARGHRRRNGAWTGAAAVVAAAVGVWSATVGFGYDRTGLEVSDLGAPVDAGPLNCPGGENSATLDYFAGRPDGTPVQQAQEWGERLVLNGYRRAELREGRGSKGLVFLYVLPNGRRVARLTINPSDHLLTFVEDCSPIYECPDTGIGPAAAACENDR